MPGYVCAGGRRRRPGRRPARGQDDRRRRRRARHGGGLRDGPGRLRRRRRVRRRSALRAVAGRHRRLQRDRHRHAGGGAARAGRLAAGAQGRARSRWARRRAYGLVLGLAAYVRAVALPLVVLAALHFRARGARWATSSPAPSLAAAVALLVLLPWGMRNNTATASCSSPTATAATPRWSAPTRTPTEATAARSTGCSRRGPATRCSRRRTGSPIAPLTSWPSSGRRFEPPYALGLLAAKADRLLTHERPLLYWPLYRQSVLPRAAVRAGSTAIAPASSGWSTGSGT